MRARSAVALALMLLGSLLPGCQDPATLSNVIPQEDFSNTNMPSSPVSNYRPVTNVVMVPVPPSPTPSPSPKPSASPAPSPSPSASASP